MRAAVELRNLTVGYRVAGRRAPVLSQIHADAAPGELVGLVGPNGAGKSTLLRTIARLQRPLSGHIGILGRPLPHLPRRDLGRHVAVVLTDRVALDHLRVRDFVQLGRHPHLDAARRLRRDDHTVVDDSLDTAGVTGLAARLFSSLSDGQRQRVLIARALAQQPHVLLLDEPTSFLDPAARLGVLSLLRRLARGGTTVIACTHEVELALRYCDTLWVAADGGLVSGAPAEVARDRTLLRPFETAGVRFDPASRSFQEVDACAATPR